MADFYFSELCATAFIDILGYRDALSKMSYESVRYDDVTSSKYDYSFWFFKHREIPELNYRRAEDAFIFSGRANNLDSIFQQVSIVYCLHLIRTVLMRGGIDVSDPICQGVVVEQNVSNESTFSSDLRKMQDQSLYRAHKIESESAKGAIVEVSSTARKYGQIVISHNVRKSNGAYQKVDVIELERLWENYFVEINGRHVLDTFYGFNRANSFRLTKDMESSMKEIYDECGTSILAIKEMLPKSSVMKEKVSYLENLFSVSRNRFENGEHFSSFSC